MENLAIEKKPKLLDQVHQLLHTKHYSTDNRIQLSSFARIVQGIPLPLQVL